MKKLISIFTIFTALLFVSVYAQDVSVSVNGQPVVFDGQGPVNIDGRILVPARGVFDALDFVPAWDGELRRATLANDEFTIVITIESAVFTTNGALHQFDVPAQIIGGSTMIPLGAVLRSIGIEPGWDADTSTVVINLPGYEPMEETPPEAPAAPSEIIGAWDFMGTRYYTFNPDGSGTRGVAAGAQSFQWSATSSMLTITTSSGAEEWIYGVEGNMLTMASIQVNGFSLIYTRNSAAVPGVGATQVASGAGLVGVWNWNGQPYYAFRPDGSGVRGTPGRYQHFSWMTSGSTLFIHGAGHAEQWMFAIDGDGLTLTSDAFGAFQYSR